MADITISITVPDAYVSRIRGAIDILDPLPQGTTYQAQMKEIIKRWMLAYVRQAEIQEAAAGVTVPEGLVT